VARCCGGIENRRKVTAGSHRREITAKMKARGDDREETPQRMKKKGCLHLKKWKARLGRNRRVVGVQAIVATEGVR